MLETLLIPSGLATQRTGLEFGMTENKTTLSLADTPKLDESREPVSLGDALSEVLREIARRRAE